MDDHDNRYARLRYTATGALAALMAAGAIAGAVALAATPSTKSPGPVAAGQGGPSKTLASTSPAKTQAPQPPVNHRPFLDAIQQLVDNGTITASEGQVVDSEIQAGGVDTDTLASSGLTPTQLQAVQAALGNAKRALVPSNDRASKQGANKRS